VHREKGAGSSLHVLEIINKGKSGYNVRLKADYMSQARNHSDTDKSSMAA